MPASIKLQQKLGDDLQVIFVECQGADVDRYEAFAWSMKWMGTHAMWTHERPIPTKGNGLPESALLGVDGTVLMQGNPMAWGKKLDEAIDKEIKKAKDAPAGTPKELAKPWSNFIGGDVAGSLAECDKLGATPALADAAKSMREEIVKRTNAKIERATWLVDGGYLREAQALLDPLAKGTKGCAEFGERVAAQVARAAAKDQANELEAGKLLAATTDKMAGKGKPFDDANVKALQHVVEKYKGTKAAARAERLIALSKINLNK